MEYDANGKLKYSKGEIKGFKLLKDVEGYKKGKVYDHFGGLISEISTSSESIEFKDKNYFKPVKARK